MSFVDYLHKKTRGVIVVWAGLLILLYTTLTVVSYTKGNAERIEANERHERRISSLAAESRQTRAVVDATYDGTDATVVEVGMYLDRIEELSIKDSNWFVDFYLWFRWSGEDVAPGDNFQVINGEGLDTQLQEVRVEDGKHYELYRIRAKITKYFNLLRFPRDDHLLI